MVCSLVNVVNQIFVVQCVTIGHDRFEVHPTADVMIVCSMWKDGLKKRHPLRKRFKFRHVAVGH